MMASDLVVVGTQWGDEGKGKFTDILCESAYAVARFQGAPNTGHTVVTEDGEFRFVQLPAGVLRGAVGVIGNGCVVDPRTLLEELTALTARRGPVELRISEIAHVIMPYHLWQDEAMETWRGAHLATSSATGFTTGQGQLGSTRRGVGPCREDKVARIGLRLIDLLDRDLLESRLRRLLPLKRALLERVYDMPPERFRDAPSTEQLTAEYHGYGKRLEPYLCDVSGFLADARREGRRLVYEGVQALGLDIEQGTYPYVSTGHSAAGGATIGTGTSPRVPFEVLGVAKVYTATVGGGPLPTELTGAVADHIVARGREVGTVTGRRRRVGWFDLPLVRRSVRKDAIEYLCLSNLDVLAGLSEIRLATHYRIGGCLTDEFPVTLREMAAIEPVYETLEGWPDQDWSAVARAGMDALPPAARRYVDRIAQDLGVRVAALGVGPRRDQTMILDMPRPW